MLAARDGGDTRTGARKGEAESNRAKMPGYMNGGENCRNGKESFNKGDHAMSTRMRYSDRQGEKSG
jgi:hypothetical protein